MDVFGEGAVTAVWSASLKVERSISASGPDAVIACKCDC